MELYEHHELNRERETERKGGGSSQGGREGERKGERKWKNIKEFLTWPYHKMKCGAHILSVFGEPRLKKTRRNSLWNLMIWWFMSQEFRRKLSHVPSCSGCLTSVLQHQRGRSSSAIWLRSDFLGSLPAVPLTTLIISLLKMSAHMALAAECGREALHPDKAEIKPGFISPCPPG